MNSSDNRATAFLAAFNDIEDHLRVQLGAKKSDSFRWMVDQAKRRHVLSETHAEDLKEFAELRNAISHGRYTKDLRPIAEPLPEAVEHIERIRDLLQHPPLALEVLGSHQKIYTFAPDDDIHDVLRIIKNTEISQFPVYKEGRAVDLLTTNTVARWVAADLDDNDHLDARSVAEVLDYAESNDRAVFLPKDATAQEALDAMVIPDGKRGLPRAAVITEHGLDTQKPLRVVGGSDVVALRNALQ
ncbi:CBS domain-containing protein [Corynebacterium lubricantis]|uniref:CBS domain-containing protein n=1 Tax=Corynebacterium lubricantis TaxID=541095 RepID=UPI00036A5177|nr:CBS domain-containing protein [Corynebacterium lubricantis]